MSDGAGHLTPATEADSERLRLLLDRMRVINRISSALGLSLNPDDIDRILLSALISRRGLGYSRSFLLRRNERRQCFQGHLALGPQTAEEARAFDREIAAEEEALDSMVERFQEGGPVGAGTREDLGLAPLLQSLNALKASTVWIDAFQTAPSTNLNETVGTVCWPFSSAESGASDPLARAASASQVMKFDSEADRDALPAPLDKTLDTEFVVIPLQTKKGIRCLILADRRFHRRRMEESDINLLEWFRSQASMALENAELFDRLNDAYRELREFDLLKSSFLSTLSHELRTPLTAILGFCELMRDGKAGAINDDQRELLRRVIGHGAHLNDMITDLLELTEVEAGGFVDLEIEPVDPLAAFMNTLQKLEPRRANKKVTIEPEIDSGMPGKILSNQQALERILFHLLDNAVKFIPDSGRVSVRFETRDNRFAIVVADTGIGISPENLRRIFDNFYQVDRRLTREFGGMGIGLTVTKKFVDALEGDIKVESELGRGTTVTLTFPSGPETVAEEE